MGIFTPGHYNQLSIKKNTKTISRTQYDAFCKEFLFGKIKGKSFGIAFCEKFGFDSIFLEALSDNTAKFHIETLGYIENCEEKIY